LFQVPYVFLLRRREPTGLLLRGFAVHVERRVPILLYWPVRYSPHRHRKRKFFLYISHTWTRPDTGVAVTVNALIDIEPAATAPPGDQMAFDKFGIARQKYLWPLPFTGILWITAPWTGMVTHVVFTVPPNAGWAGFTGTGVIGTEPVTPAVVTRLTVNSL
jgi:hypothetical protein